MLGLSFGSSGLSRSGRKAIVSFGSCLAARPLVWQWPAKNISLGSVVKWHELGRANPFVYPRTRDYEFVGFEANKRHYSVGRTFIAQLDAVVRHDVIENFACDLLDVEGFGASKAPLSQLADMDEFATQRSAKYIEQISESALKKNLAHKEIRILHSPGSDFFVRHSWDGRLFLANNGGSHHLSTARYIAARLPIGVPLCAPLHSYTFDEKALDAVLGNYCFGVIDSPAVLVTAFFQAMSTAKAGFYWFRPPAPYDQLRGIIFPRKDIRSHEAFGLLKTMGMFDLGAYLKTLAANASTG